MTAAFEEQLSLICELQEIDTNLHNLQQELDSLPQQLKDVEEAYFAVKTEYDAAKTELDETEKTKKNDELELVTSTDYLRTREARLYAIKTNKEYQAALKEISEGKRINKEREDRILQAMEKIDTLTQKTTQLFKEYADKEGEYRKKQDAVKEEEANIRDTMEKAAVKRPEIVAKIDRALIRKYEFVRQRYAKAVANVTGGVCQGCSRRIPPQLFNEMLRRDELKTCPSCQRLIHVVEAPRPEPGERPPA